MNKYDVIIVGGGASGMFSALVIKRYRPDLKVAVIEQLPRVGKKLIVTGNGRCNISNTDLSINRYHGENVAFAEYALNKFDYISTEKFFNDFGLIFTVEENGRAYPYSLQASSVVDVLRFSLEERNIGVFSETKLLSFEKNNNSFFLKTDNGGFECKKLIVAAGLYSGGKKIGSSGDVYEMLKNKGYKTVKTTPAIVQIKTDNKLTRSLKGIKVNADAALLINGKSVKKEYGEVLFCDYGLSGPPIMQLSREVDRMQGDKKIILDLMPEYDFTKLYDIIKHRASMMQNRLLGEFFTGMLNKRLGQSVIKLCKLDCNSPILLKNSDIKAITSVVKRMEFKVTGTNGFENSQVTAGGLDTKQFNPKTMESYIHSGLYCIGEILDIDGDCGGYNLQWAWSSGYCAATDICNKFDKKPVQKNDYK